MPTSLVAGKWDRPFSSCPVQSASWFRCVSIKATTFSARITFNPTKIWNRDFRGSNQRQNCTCAVKKFCVGHDVPIPYDSFIIHPRVHSPTYPTKRDGSPRMTYIFLLSSGICVAAVQTGSQARQAGSGSARKMRGSKHIRVLAVLVRPVPPSTRSPTFSHALPPLFTTETCGGSRSWPVRCAASQGKSRGRPHFLPRRTSRHGSERLLAEAK